MFLWLTCVFLAGSTACNKDESSTNHANKDSATPKSDAMLQAGAAAPKLATDDHRGVHVDLHAPDSPVTLVYFYPKDDTPGCTTEACAIRDIWDKYEAAGIRVLGVSSDDSESHKAFAQKHKLPFGLIPDTEHTWADAFGVATRMGFFARVSFLIDKEHKIAKVYPDVDPGVHAQQVLSDAETLK